MNYYYIILDVKNEELKRRTKDVFSYFYCRINFQKLIKMLDEVIAAFSCKHQETHFRIWNGLENLSIGLRMQTESNRLLHENKTHHIQAFI